METSTAEKTDLPRETLRAPNFHPSFTLQTEAQRVTLDSLNIKNRYEHTNDRLWSATYRKHIHSHLTETEEALKLVVLGV